MSSAPSQPKLGPILHRLCPSCDVEVLEEITHCKTCGSKLVEVRDEIDTIVGTVVDGRFEIRGKLGQGGMGTVYRAWQKSVGREIAIKLIDRSYSRDAMAVRRFLREARLASQLSQPNTVSVFDFGQVEDGRLFIAMELIRGRTLHDVIQADGAFSIERTVRIGVQICDALEAAHAIGIVHRDLKLENVIVLDHPPGRDLLKVLDFGLAKNIHEPGSRATESGIVVGTPRYMSPEASTTGETGPSSDVYSLGVILGELATGKPMWKGESLAELIAQKLDPKPVIERAPAALRGVLERLLDPEPGGRPSASQVRQLLSNLTSGAPVKTASSAEPSSDLRGKSPSGDKGSSSKSESPSPEATRKLTPSASLAMAPTAAPMPLTPMPAASPSLASATSTQEPATRSRWPLVMIGTGVIAAIVGVAVVATRDRSTSARAEPQAQPAVLAQDAAAVALAADAGMPAIAADAEISTTPPAAPELVTIHVESQPEGATIVFGGATYTAPCDLVVELGKKPIEVRASLPGRQTKKLSIVPDATKTQVIKLPRRAAARSDEVAPF